METEGWNDQENVDYKTKGSKVVKKDLNTQQGLRVRTNVPARVGSLNDCSNTEPAKTEEPPDERSNKYKKCLDELLDKEEDTESDIESDLSLLDIHEVNIDLNEEKEQQQSITSLPLAEKSKSGNCEEFLAFEPTEIPPWRASVEGNSSIPPVSQMIRDIVLYQEWYQLKQKTGREKRRRVKRNLLLRFLCNVQKEENIGSQGDTAEIMDMIDREDEQSISPSGKRKLSDGDCEESAKKLHVETEESPEFETFPSIENDLESLHDSISTHQAMLPSKSKLETMNLYRAYKHIMTELNKYKTDTSTKDDDFGLIEMNALINETHRVLMEGVMKEAQMPGRFCTNRRETKFRGRDFKYPWFGNETVVDKAVETIIDKYNDILDVIKQRKENKGGKLSDTSLCDTFKIASLFLFSFLTLHPFGDGNGRLARLLASYTMLTFSPFMTPIYNVFSSSTENDYIQALVDARENLQLPEERVCNSDEAVKLAVEIFRQKPSDLCAMLVESNWTMWRQILVDLEDSRIQLFDWEIQHQKDLSRTFEIANE